MKRTIFILKKGRRKFQRTFCPCGISSYIDESDWVNNKVTQLLGDVASYEKVGTYFDFVECVEFDEFVVMNSKKQNVTIRVYKYEDTESD